MVETEVVSVRLPVDVVKYIREHQVDLRAFICSALPSSIPLGGEGEFLWSSVRLNDSEACKYMRRLDGLSDFERLQRDVYKDPKRLAGLYLELAAARKVVTGAALAEVSARIDSILEFVLNGDRYSYLPVGFLKGFEEAVL